MKPALSEKHTAVPSDWAQFAQGPELATDISKLLEPWWQKIFGYYLLKVGDLSCQLDTAQCKTTHQINLGLDTETVNLRAEPDALPVREHSVDAVLLAQCLEYSSDPHHVVREAHRVLMPDGYLLLTGFNPFSLMGVLGSLPWLKQRYPWSGRFFSASRVKDWLHLVGFEVVSEQRFFCSNMLARETRRGALSLWSERYLNYFGACYLLVARKRELPLTPIRPRWRLNTEFNPAVKGVSARQSIRQISEYSCRDKSDKS
ncbi:methyltransferase domain-containing protein [Chromatiaceae bacterium AAb-1]|nr:methyltransferase domain-containing protein [Chromatiaceae bacterium AAb-1]